MSLSLACGTASPVIVSEDQLPASSNGLTFWQKGFAFYDRPEAYAAPGTLASLRRLRAIGANYVAPVVTWYVESRSGSKVYRGGLTPTDEQLSAFIQRAHLVGLNVLLTLHVDSEDRAWRGFLAPADVGGWFASYRDMVLHYADLAATQRADGLVVGKELVLLSGPAHTAEWTGLICEVRSHYGGFLTYSANWGGGGVELANDPLEEFTKIQFWDYLDALGLSAYFELSESYDPSPEELAQAWDLWNRGRIAPFQAQHGMPVLFTELGYRSVAGAAVHPWDQNVQSALNPQGQADLYRAFFSYWSGVPWVAGAYIWSWEASTNAGGPLDGGYTPQNKPAEKVISSWFSLHEFWVSGRSAPHALSVRANVRSRCDGPPHVAKVDRLFPTTLEQPASQANSTAKLQSAGPR